MDITRAKNDAYRLPLRQCDRTNFKSESRLVMAQHWSAPFALGHGPPARPPCHYCAFEAKESHLVAAHVEAEHDMRSRPALDRLMHQCPLCPFEDNIKSKVTRHVLSCQKRHVPERNQVRLLPSLSLFLSLSFFQVHLVIKPSFFVKRPLWFNIRESKLIFFRKREVNHLGPLLKARQVLTFHSTSF